VITMKGSLLFTALLLCASCSATGPAPAEGAPARGAIAVAQDQAPPEHHGLVPVPSSYDSRDAYLSGDWGGRRTSLAEQGLQIGASLTQVGQDVVDGGLEEGFEYGAKLETAWSLDLDRSGTIPGGLLTMRTESRAGDSVNRAAGAVLPVNDVLYFPLTEEPDEDIPLAITELRYTQFLSSSVGVFLGKFTPLGGDVNEFAGGRGDTQFMSHAFLTASVTALVNPYSTLGAGAIWLPSKDLVVTSSIFSAYDSSTTSGLSHLDEGLIWTGSLRGQYECGELPGGMMLTVQYGFDNEFVDFEGSFVGGDGVQIPLEDDTWNAVWNMWQYLQVEPGSDERIDVTNSRTDREGFGVFARAAVADRDTNPIRFSVSGGVAGRGILPGRDRDTAGLGFAYSDAQEEPLVTGTLLDTASRRTELYYSIHLGFGSELTFDCQWADPLLAKIDPSLIFGFRLRTKF